MPTPMRRVSFKRAERLEYGVSDQARVRASSRSAVATHLISDGYENEYEGAGLITNDSELLGPVQLDATRVELRPWASGSTKRLEGPVGYRLELAGFADDDKAGAAIGRPNHVALQRIATPPPVKAP